MIKLNRLLYLLAAIKFLLPFFLQNNIYEPHRDELLYLAEGSHPAFGYMEIPPLLSVFAWFTQIFGNGMFWIKFWPCLFGSLNFILIGKLIIDEGGKFFALFLAFCCFFFTGFIRVHFLFQPNVLEIFFYTVIGYALVKYAKSSENKWLYLAGLGAGLGLLSKYSVAFYLICLVPALLLSNQRKVFLNRHLYYSLALGMLLFLPNFIWQAVHHFPVVYHMHELTTTQLQYLPSSVFLANQLLIFLPVCFIWVIGFFYLLLNPKNRNYIFLCWAYLGVIGLLLWFHGKDYYALGLYPILFCFGCLALEKWTSRKSFYFFRFVVVTLVVSLGIFMTFMGLPLLPPKKLASFYEKIHAKGSGVLRWEDQQDHPLPQDFADMLGWEEMAGITASAFRSMDSVQQSQTIIFANNYGMAGAINYYGKKFSIPEAYSDNASFLYWLPDSLSYRNFILITSDTLDLQRPFMKEFEEVRLWGRVTDSFAREKGTQVILMKGASPQFQKFFKQKIEEDRLKLVGHD